MEGAVAKLVNLVWQQPFLVFFGIIGFVFTSQILVGILYTIDGFCLLYYRIDKECIHYN